MYIYDRLQGLSVIQTMGTGPLLKSGNLPVPSVIDAMEFTNKSDQCRCSQQ